MVGFLSSTRLLNNPFFITLFCLLFRAQTVSDGFICIGACNHRKFLEGFSRKLETQWQRKFFFVAVPEGFPLRRHWAEPITGISNKPDKVDGMSDHIQRLY